MPSRHEAITLALLSALDAHASTVLRESDLELECPPEGLINVTPEDPEEEEQRLGTGDREWSRDYALEFVVRDADSAARSIALDAAMVAAAQLLAGTTLEGTVDYLRLERPAEYEDAPMDGAASLKGAVLTVTVFYETPDNPMEA